MVFGSQGVSDLANLWNFVSSKLLSCLEQFPAVLSICKIP
jgi:hypothetical protein